MNPSDSPRWQPPKPTPFSPSRNKTAALLSECSQHNFWHCTPGWMPPWHVVTWDFFISLRPDAIKLPIRHRRGVIPGVRAPNRQLKFHKCNWWTCYGNGAKCGYFYLEEVLEGKFVNSQRYLSLIKNGAGKICMLRKKKKKMENMTSRPGNHRPPVNQWVQHARFIPVCKARGWSPLATSSESVAWLDDSMWAEATTIRPYKQDKAQPARKMPPMILLKPKKASLLEFKHSVI